MINAQKHWCRISNENYGSGNVFSIQINSIPSTIQFWLRCILSWNQFDDTAICAQCTYTYTSMFLRYMQWAHSITKVVAEHMKIRITFLKIFRLSINLLALKWGTPLMSRLLCFIIHARLVSVKLNLQFVINSELAEKMQPFAINKREKWIWKFHICATACLFEIQVEFIFSSIPSVVISDSPFIRSCSCQFAIHSI